ncbi:hypothetical protein [Burkholderia ubonensis]|uniref:Beta-ketoacyl synthase N-terminal domain-containing protein n=1 Tax=Burkholderia ubonensis subsp. mesacidophila TaxID=265293 RepID=A0A2A4FLN0_9BURK|nr:hypothetical protein [Burkholderia ubonensis]PCE33259.1 hypothetical protein BZL54_05970 [Burkholderia ubonensis subsp. mesacidophila]
MEDVSESSGTVAFAGFGGVTSAGLTAAQTVNAVLAGCPRLAHSRRHPSARTGEDIKVARLMCLDDAMSIEERIVALGRHALKEALDASRETLDAVPATRSRVPVLLALPPHRVGLASQAARRMAGEICDAHDGIDKAASRIFDTGHAGFLAALAAAGRLIRTRRYDACVVGSADSLADLDYLHWLEQSRRLKAPDAPFGFSAGEGAAFAVVHRADARADAGRPFVRIHEVGFDAEPDLWFEGQASQGHGLTSAIAQALAGRDAIDCCYGDLNGETWRSAEWDFASLRNGRQFRSPLDVRHPAEIWGDTGAASAALNCLLACSDLLGGVEDFRQVLVFASSDVNPWRASVVLERIDAGGSHDPDRYRQ